MTFSDLVLFNLTLEFPDITFASLCKQFQVLGEQFSLPAVRLLHHKDSLNYSTEDTHFEAVPTHKGYFDCDLDTSHSPLHLNFKQDIEVKAFF